MGNKRSRNNPGATKTMKSAIKVILVMVLWSQFVIGGPIRCSLVRNFLIYYPDDPGAEMECKACPECPLGLGLVPQCGTKITNYTTIKCEPCQQNKTYSDKHGIESCRSCHDCGLTNVIQKCTPYQNRKCGTECPERHYLDDNGFCQECYFCCPSVDETGRMKKCKEIGMGEDWQCPKNDQNKDCKEDFENSTEASVHTINSPPGHNFEANKTDTNSSDNIRKPTSSFENTTLPSMLTREKKGDVAPSTIVTIITLIALVIVGVVYGARRIIKIGMVQEYNLKVHLNMCHYA